MFSNILRVFVVLVFLPASSFAETSLEKTTRLLSLTGFDETFSDVRDGVLVENQSGQIPTDAPLALIWPIAAKRHFDNDEMLANTAERLSRLLSDAELDNLIELYSTDFALRISALEEKEQNAVPFDQITKLGTEIATKLAAEAPERLRQYFEMIDMLGMLDSTVTLVMNMQHAFLSGASLTGLLSVPMTDQQIVDALSTIEPQIRSEMLNTLVAQGAYVYRDLSDEEVAQYITFLAIPEVTRMYLVLGQIIDDVMTLEFAAFALTLGEMAPQSEL